MSKKREVTVYVSPGRSPRIASTPKGPKSGPRIQSYRSEWYAPSPDKAGPLHRAAWAALEGGAATGKKKVLKDRLEAAIKQSAQLRYGSLSVSPLVSWQRGGDGQVQLVFAAPMVPKEIVDGRTATLGFMDLPKAQRRMW